MNTKNDNNQYQAFWEVCKEYRLVLGIALVASLFFNAFYFFFNNIGVTGPDAIEYYQASLIFQKYGFGYVFQDAPVTLWRLPVLPLLLAICSTTDIYCLVQIGLSYFLPLWFFFIFLALKFNKQESLYVAIFSMFIPYLNIAKCGVGTEFLQVFFFVYITYKILYKKHDILLYIVVTLLCFLRAEGFIIAIVVFALTTLSNNKKQALWILIPIISLNLWQYRNLQLFDTYTIVNPILSSRALIGSIYGVIYLEKPHEFHKKYNYYEGTDYKRKKAFVKEYKEIVSKELKNYILQNPLQYIKHRLYWASKCYFYLSFNHERLPNEQWGFSRTINRAEIEKTNQTWGYKQLLEKKDYFRLGVRLTYHISLAVGQLVGLLYLLFFFRRFWKVLLVLATFGYVFIVEADMRYLIFPQTIALLMGFCLLLQLLKVTFFHKQYGQFLRYVAVGGSCFVLEMILFSIMLTAIGKNYVYAINTFTFCIALVWNYIASRMWIFEIGKYDTKTEAFAFMTVGIVALGLSNLIIALSINFLLLSILTSKILAIILVTIWNFVMKKYFVFKG